MEIKQINVLGQNYNIKDAFGRALIANEYNSENEYGNGDFCLYGGNLYKCLSGTTGSWNSNAWSQTTIVDNLEGGGSGYNFDITQDEWDTIVAINNQTISGTLSLSGVTKVADYMFQSCTSLEGVDFPNCTTIGDSAFYSCTSLQSANFSNCTSIGGYAFNWCTSLQSISFPSCTIIGSFAFQFCGSLQSVSFPSCTTIGGSAFYGCDSLQSVSFLNCTTIGAHAFNLCTSLQSVSFPNCTTIGEAAFNDTGLQSIDLPVCTTIGQGAFNQCFSLSALYLLGSSVCKLSTTEVFIYTPIEDSSYLGYYGSIYVPSSLVASYKIATNWATYADRITAYQE